MHDGFKRCCEIKRHLDLKLKFSAIFTQIALILSEFRLSDMVLDLYNRLKPSSDQFLDQ